MSMHYAGESGYGMFLNNDEAVNFLTEYAKTHDPEYDPDDDYYDPMMFVYEEESLCLSDLTDDDYDMRGIRHLNRDRVHPEDEDDFIDGIFLYSEKQGSIVAGSDSLYDSLEEMADEFRKTYGDSLPDDFDYIDHLCFFRGANFA